MSEEILTIKQECENLRFVTNQTVAAVKRLMGHWEFKGPPAGSDAGEMKANIMLAYRHLEDARMRLGKVIQAYEGGVSAYERAK